MMKNVKLPFSLVRIKLIVYSDEFVCRKYDILALVVSAAGCSHIPFCIILLHEKECIPTFCT